MTKPFNPKYERPLYLECGCWVLTDERMEEMYGADDSVGELSLINKKEIDQHVATCPQKKG